MTKSEFLIAPGYERVTGQRLTAERMTCLLEREEKRDQTGNEKTLCIVEVRAKGSHREIQTLLRPPFPPHFPKSKRIVYIVASAGTGLRPADAHTH